jgi:hypothetical protein
MHTRLNPKKTEPKYSHGPKPIARDESTGHRVKSATELKTPPKNDAKVPMASASVDLPFNVNGYPSNVVATAAAVPGIRNSIADTRPPETPPIYIPIIIHTVGMTSIAKVNGSTKATAIGVFSPGIAPNVIPMTVPRKINARFVGVKTLVIICNNSMLNHPCLKYIIMLIGLKT